MVHGLLSLHSDVWQQALGASRSMQNGVWIPGPTMRTQQSSVGSMQQSVSSLPAQTVPPWDWQVGAGVVVVVGAAVVVVTGGAVVVVIGGAVVPVGGTGEHTSAQALA
jgi:hypothetical protein